MIGEKTDDVAPRVGAWIETNMDDLSVIGLLSHPVWVRGLKLPPYRIDKLLVDVAPRVGAWIETSAPSPCPIGR